jgi:hypothetical protein
MGGKSAFGDIRRRSRLRRRRKYRHLRFVGMGGARFLQDLRVEPVLSIEGDWRISHAGRSVRRSICFRITGEIFIDRKPPGYDFAGDHPRLTEAETMVMIEESGDT